MAETLDDTNYITPTIRAMIGVPAEPVVACDPVEAGAVRRFAQAIMDDDPVYWDVEAARAAGFHGIVAPPLYPLHAIRRQGGTPDPLAAAVTNPDYDGAGQGAAARVGLPEVPIPLKRLLNGGNDIELYSQAVVGERIVAESRYHDIYQKQGSRGPLVFVIIETLYRTESGRPLLRSRQTLIWR